jgi:ribonucleotide monophosphatase NagD (HAD superfamily)
MKPLPFAYLRALDKIALKRARSSGRALGFAQNSLGVESSSGRALGFGQNSPGVDLGIGKVAVIGDQLLTDVLGARLLGLNPILVEPLSTTDLWYTQLFRRVERVLLNDMRPLG